MKATISIRWSLFQTLIVVVVLITSAILAATWHFGTRAVQAVARSLLDRAAEHADVALEHYLAPARDDLAMIRSWTQAGRFDARDEEATNALLMPLLLAHPQINMFTSGDPAGYHLLLRREGDTFYNREMRPEWGSTARISRWKDARTLLTRVDRVETFNHRERPWYTSAISRPVDAGLFWTGTYRAHDSQQPIITAALRVDHPVHGVEVVALHLFLRDISEFTTRMAPSPQGIVAVLDDGDRLIGLPRDERFAEIEARDAALLKRAGEIDVPALGVATSKWRGMGRPSEPFGITIAGARWWVGFRRVVLSERRSFWIGTLVPESDFVGAIQEQQRVVLLIGFVLLLISAMISLFVSRSYSRVLRQLVEQSERIQDLDLASHATISSRLREVHQLAQAHERMRVALESFAKYVPIELVRELLRRGEAAQIGGRAEVLTVFFSDIRGFTSISEKLAPEALTAQMSEYFAAMLEVLSEEKATIDKFIGDAIMAFWGAPAPDPQHAAHGIRAALRCQARLASLNATWIAQGRPALETRIGLATGRVVVGNVGAPTRLNYTLLGDTANLASRLEGANRFYGTGILASEATRAAGGDVAEWREVDRVAVKGKDLSVGIHEPLGLRGAVSVERRAWAAEYEACLGAYRERAFERAKARLAILAAEHPDDTSVTRLAEACQQSLANAQPADWNGATALHEK